MKIQNLAATALLAGLFCLEATAQSPQFSNSKFATSVSKSVHVASKKPLELPIVPSEALQAASQDNAPVEVLDQADRLWNAFREEHSSLVRSRAAYITQHQRCYRQEFSIADQRRAGCRSTDTVGACTAKLLRMCTGSYRSNYMRQRVDTVRAARQLETAISRMRSGYPVPQ